MQQHERERRATRSVFGVHRNRGRVLRSHSAAAGRLLRRHSVASRPIIVSVGACERPSSASASQRSVAPRPAVIVIAAGTRTGMS
jgi:hypothetical protein